MGVLLALLLLAAVVYVGWRLIRAYANRPPTRVIGPINGADAARFLVRLSGELSDSFQFLIRA